MSDKSWGIGESLISSSPNQVIVGTYNAPISTDTVFCVGSGNNVERNNAMVIKSSGELYLSNKIYGPSDMFIDSSMRSELGELIVDLGWDEDVEEPIE